MNELTSRSRTAMRSAAGPVGFAMLIAVGPGSIGWAIAIALVAALGFAGYVLAPWVAEQRALTVRRRDEIRDRADRQHRWALRGDSRDFYGPDGAELMRRIAADANRDDVATDSGEQPQIAAVADTAEGLATLLAERPACWRYAVFGSVLVQRYAALQRREPPAQEHDQLHRVGFVVERRDPFVALPDLAGVHVAHGRCPAGSHACRYAQLSLRCVMRCRRQAPTGRHANRSWLLRRSESCAARTVLAAGGGCSPVDRHASWWVWR